MHNPSFPSNLRTAYEYFQNHSSSNDNSFIISITINDSLFCGVPNSLQQTHNPQSLRNTIINELGFPQSSSPPPLTQVSILQVIGDSGTPFTSQALRAATTLLDNLITPNTILEYGYTASKHDSNWLINEFVMSGRHDGLSGDRTFGNLVYQSGIAVDEWGCEATDLVRRFVVCYNHDRDCGVGQKKKTVFGDDTWVSDGIMSAEFGDVLVCFEGGVQAFEQCVNGLGKGVRVVVLTGEGVRDGGEKGGQGERFSAAGLLRILRDANVDDEGLGYDDDDESKRRMLQDVASKYLARLWEMDDDDNSKKYMKVMNDLGRLLGSLESLRLVEVNVMNGEI